MFFVFEENSSSVPTSCVYTMSRYVFVNLMTQSPNALKMKPSKMKFWLKGLFDVNVLMRRKHDPASRNSSMKSDKSEMSALENFSATTKVSESVKDLLKDSDSMPIVRSFTSFKSFSNGTVLISSVFFRCNAER